MFPHQSTFLLILYPRGKVFAMFKWLCFPEKTLPGISFLPQETSRQCDWAIFPFCWFSLSVERAQPFSHFQLHLHPPLLLLRWATPVRAAVEKFWNNLRSLCPVKHNSCWYQGMGKTVMLLLHWESTEISQHNYKIPNLIVMHLK